MIETTESTGLTGPGRNVVLENEADWRVFWAEHRAGTPQADTPPAVDFSKEMVVALIQASGNCAPFIIRGVQAVQPAAGPGARVVAEVRYNHEVAFCIPSPLQPVTVARIANPTDLQMQFRQLPVGAM